MKKIILWDVDGTLLDFSASQNISLRVLFSRLDLGECTDAMLERYTEINRKHWELIERGEETKKEALVNRFRDFFVFERIPFSRYAEFDAAYRAELGNHFTYMENAPELLAALKSEGYRQIAVTNGTLDVQSKKLALSGLDRLFDAVFISDAVGFEKPSPRFFDAVFASLPGVSKTDCLLVGDSLTSDIKGAVGVGVECVWYNPKHKKNTSDVTPTHEIHRLADVRAYL